MSRTTYDMTTDRTTVWAWTRLSRRNREIYRRTYYWKPIFTIEGNAHRRTA